MNTTPPHRISVSDFLLINITVNGSSGCCLTLVHTVNTIYSVPLYKSTVPVRLHTISHYNDNSTSRNSDVDSIVAFEYIPITLKKAFHKHLVLSARVLQSVCREGWGAAGALMRGC